MTGLRSRPGVPGWAGPSTRAVLFSLVLLYGCGNRAETQRGPPTPLSPSQAMVGTYEYVYPFNSRDLVENHFIVLGLRDGALAGWYFGTSDEFDTGREGYLPGFFVAEMVGLTAEAGEIHFSLDISADDCFTEPIPLEYRSSNELSPGRFVRWSGPTATRRHPLRYSGSVSEGLIQLETPSGPRAFARSPVGKPGPKGSP